MSDGPSRSIAYQGARLTIEYARLASGSCPGLDYWNSLDARWQARLYALFERLANQGFISNKEQFRKEEGDLFSFKAYQARLLCYYAPRKAVVVITHGFTKKTDRMSRGELKKGQSIKAEYEALLAR
jgi:hypothetical protein